MKKIYLLLVVISFCRVILVSAVDYPPLSSTRYSGPQTRAELEKKYGYVFVLVDGRWQPVGEGMLTPRERAIVRQLLDEGKTSSEALEILQKTRGIFSLGTNNKQNKGALLKRFYPFGNLNRPCEK